MKKSKIIILTCISAFVLCITAIVFINKQDTILETPATDFEYSIDDGCVLINKYLGNDDIVKIPNEIENLPVKVIGFNAFMSNTSIKTIIIPDTVETIRDYAFFKCEYLTDVHFGKSVKEIRYHAFSHCNALEKIELPSNLEIVGTYAFSECSSLKTITIPKTLNTWGNQVFYNNKSLTTINFEEGLKIIGGLGAFADCDSFEIVTIPASIKEINYQAFDLCEKLRIIKFLGDAPKKLDTLAFGQPSKNITIYYIPSTHGWDNTILSEYNLQVSQEQ